MENFVIIKPNPDYEPDQDAEADKKKWKQYIKMNNKILKNNWF